MMPGGHRQVVRHGFVSHVADGLRAVDVDVDAGRVGRQVRDAQLARVPPAPTRASRTEHRQQAVRSIPGTIASSESLPSQLCRRRFLAECVVVAGTDGRGRSTGGSVRDRRSSCVRSITSSCCEAWLRSMIGGAGSPGANIDGHVIGSGFSSAQPAPRQCRTQEGDPEPGEDERDDTAESCRRSTRPCGEGSRPLPPRWPACAAANRTRRRRARSSTRRTASRRTADRTGVAGHRRSARPPRSRSTDRATRRGLPAGRAALRPRSAVRSDPPDP